MTQFDQDLEALGREQLFAEVRKLRSAIREHHRQKADDRCIEDDDRLYAAAGLPPCDRRVGDKAAMLRNCWRFINNRCEGGGWPTYAELEKRIKDLEGQHKGMVLANRILRDRPDLPPERTRFYEDVLKLQEFKQLTHQLLDEMGVPAFDKVECRLRARLAWLGAVLQASKEVVKSMVDVMRPTDFANDQYDRVYAWYELEPLAAALGMIEGAADGEPVPNL